VQQKPSVTTVARTDTATSAKQVMYVIARIPGVYLLIYLSVSLSAGLHKQLQADLAEIFEVG